MAKATIYFKGGNIINIDKLKFIRQAVDSKTFTVDQWEESGLDELRYIFVGENESVFFNGLDVACVRIEK